MRAVVGAGAAAAAKQKKALECTAQLPGCHYLAFACLAAGTAPQWRGCFQVDRVDCSHQLTSYFEQ